MRTFVIVYCWKLQSTVTQTMQTSEYIQYIIMT